MKEIIKIAITGGPCGGKSSAMALIKKTYTSLGYTVLSIRETATGLISGGVAPKTCAMVKEYQTYQMRLQLLKEEVFSSAAKNMDNDKILIVCDRGTIDNKAYMSEYDYYSLLKELGLNEVQLRDTYDGVFHLVTTAKGAIEYYTTANNSARDETPEEAAELDDRLIDAWTGHPHFRIIDNSTDFNGKMKRLMAEISALLGIPKPLEIERKFLIEYPNIKYLESLSNCKAIEIEQTYLQSDNGDEIRVRKRGETGSYIYFKTVKSKIEGTCRTEIEGRISESEYIDLLKNADESRRSIEKTRYCLSYDSQYFEIDIYPFWQDKAIMEIELTDENTEIRFPDWIKVIKEVTNDDSYKNASIAKI